MCPCSTLYWSETMKPAPFAYQRAENLSDVFAIFAAHGDEVRLLAGGQSLIPIINMRLATPEVLLDINGIKELEGVLVENGKLRIGALTRLRDLSNNPDIITHVPLLAMAAPHIAHTAVRNRGTVGGSLCHADPAAELPACMIALDAKINIASASSTRQVNANDFVTGIFDTSLASNEILTSVDIPLPISNQQIGFDELARRHGDYAMVGLAAKGVCADGNFSDLNLVYFSVADRPILAIKTMAAVTDNRDTVTALDEDLANAIDDLHTSAITKKHLAGILLNRVLEQMRGGEPS